MAICHLIVGDMVLGEADEACFLPTWFFQITRIRDFFKANRHSLFPAEFKNLSDREIFEIILKSNQLEAEFDNNYLYLPQLNNILWQRHYLTIDETIDGFCICYFIKQNEIRFAVEKVWPQPEDEGDRIFLCKSVEVDFFIKTIDEAIEFLGLTYPYLTNHKNTR